MKKYILFALVFISLSAWVSCTKDTAIAPPAAPVCDSTHVSYTQSIVPIMNTYCAGASQCQSNALGLGASANDLTSYINVKNSVEIDSPNVNSLLCRVQTSTCGNDIMPKGTSRGLRAVYVDTIKLWKAGGYCN